MNSKSIYNYKNVITKISYDSSVDVAFEGSLKRDVLSFHMQHVFFKEVDKNFSFKKSINFAHSSYFIQILVSMSS